MTDADPSAQLGFSQLESNTSPTRQYELSDLKGAICNQGWQGLDQSWLRGMHHINAVSFKFMDSDVQGNGVQVGSMPIDSSGAGKGGAAENVPQSLASGTGVPERLSPGSKGNRRRVRSCGLRLGGPRSQQSNLRQQARSSRELGRVRGVVNKAVTSKRSIKIITCWLTYEWRRNYHEIVFHPKVVYPYIPNRRNTCNLWTGWAHVYDANFVDSH